jgi:isocitrate dehydrogenase kinase/phosphatase
MPEKLTDSRLANLGASALHEAFDAYRDEFQIITERAKIRFKDLDWHGMRADTSERLDLYKKSVDRIETDIRKLLASRVHDKLVWAGIKAVYSSLIGDHNDWELAETFFNSVTRRVFATVGVDPQIEFVVTDFESPPTQAASAVFRTYDGPASIEDLVRSILTDYPYIDAMQDLQRDAEWVADEIETHLLRKGLSCKIERAEMVENIFYRGMGAYIIGRLYADSVLVPVAIALLNRPEGIHVDAVLLEENQISILLSFARSYFHVEVQRPYDLVRFLKSILPRKRISELYISTGFNKHGKTVLYREILDHLKGHPQDRFEISRGARGMVMMVFNMPRDDLVFKLIRDRFVTPKKSTRQVVMGKYDMVFRHDRAGRLVDAQSFEHLEFDKDLFSPDLLDELLNEAGQTVWIENDQVIVDYAYVERRVTPLDLYIQEADEQAGRKAVIDYGRAIKDLAVSNIFPGDFLLKNFGVTRHGRVVFYDYDELCLLTSCNFRKLPESSSYEEELSDEPWFYVGEHDFFPEEFRRFLGLPDPLRNVFMEHHANILEVDFWLRAQEAIKAGELPHIYPYERNGKPGQSLGPRHANKESSDES